MPKGLTWDDAKRRENLEKHGLDFADAALVLESDIRMDVATVRDGEARMQSFAYVYERLRVLSLVHVPGEVARIVSFRTASTIERSAYHEWLGQDDSE